MARIRTIKPKFWDDLKVGRLSRDARLLYIGMWNFADDCGVIIGDLIWLKSKVFPYDQIQVQQFEKWIKELEINGFICQFSYQGEDFIYLPTFSRHQVINKPNFEDLNIPKDVLDSQLRLITEQSRNDTGIITEQSIPIKGEEKDIENNNSCSTASPSESDAEFEKFWQMYDKKSNKAKTKAKFSKLSKADKAKIFEALPAYVASTPDKQFRKDPLTYLNARAWEDEIIQRSGNLFQQPQRQAPAGVTLGKGEWITADGRRTYGQGKANIPMNAPPRPADGYSWDMDNGRWIYQ